MRSNRLSISRPERRRTTGRPWGHTDEWAVRRSASRIQIMFSGVSRSWALTAAWHAVVAALRRRASSTRSAPPDRRGLPRGARRREARHRTRRGLPRGARHREARHRTGAVFFVWGSLPSVITPPLGGSRRHGRVSARRRRRGVRRRASLSCRAPTGQALPPRNPAPTRLRTRPSGGAGGAPARRAPFARGQLRRAMMTQISASCDHASSR